jgi:PAS domain S-box-containing protein
MNIASGIQKMTFDFNNNLQFEDIFSLEEIQRIQDMFSSISGVASIIIHPNGDPITKPSNFCRLCENTNNNRETEYSKYFNSDTAPDSNIHSCNYQWMCLDGGLWNTGEKIVVSGKHIANWLTGKVNNEVLEERTSMSYSNESAVNGKVFVKVMNDLPAISMEQAKKVSEMLFLFAREVSEKGNSNLLLKIQMAKHEKATASLKEYENKFCYFFENTKDILYQTEITGIIREISPSIKDATGYKSEELIGTQVSILYDNPNDRSFLINSLMKKGMIRDHEFKMKTKAGTIIQVSINANLISDAVDNQMYIVGVIRNITERKLSKEILIESEARYQSLFENMLNGYAYCQMLYDDGQPNDFIYLNVNKVFETLTGLRNVEGKRVTELIPGIRESDNNLFEIYGRVALTGIPEFVEMHVEALNDWYSISVYSTKREYFIAVFDVITKRKLAEKELIEAKEKAEESDRLKTAFLNNISHEIRTPFNGILGFLSLIQDHDLPDDERDEYIGVINESAERLMTTINDIVEVSYIQSGQVKLMMKDANINAITDKLFDKFNPFAKSKGLEFIIKNDLPHNLTNIITDRFKLKAILSNLIGNALKFTKVGSVRMGMCLKSGFLEFCVKDTGIGISADKQHIIFERFMQSNISNTREYEGLGLGLTIVKGYVIMFGGKLWLESEEGKGTTFYFTIPFII